MPPRSLHAKIDEMAAQMARIESKLTRLATLATLDGELIMANQADLEASFADLTAEVAAEATVEQSAVKLLNGLAIRLENALNGAVNYNDLRARIDTIKQKIASSTAELAGSVTANTPADGQPPAPASTSANTPAEGGGPPVAPSSSVPQKA